MTRRTETPAEKATRLFHAAIVRLSKRIEKSERCADDCESLDKLTKACQRLYSRGRKEARPEGELDIVDALERRCWEAKEGRTEMRLQNIKEELFRLAAEKRTLEAAYPERAELLRSLQGVSLVFPMEGHSRSWE